MSYSFKRTKRRERRRRLRIEAGRPSMDAQIGWVEHHLGVRLRAMLTSGGFRRLALVTGRRHLARLAGAKGDQ